MPKTKAINIDTDNQSLIDEIEEKLNKIKETEQRLNNQKRKNKENSKKNAVVLDRNSKIDSHLKKMLKKVIPEILEDVNSDGDFEIYDEDSDIIQEISFVAIRESIIAIVTGCSIGVLEEIE